MQVSGEIMRRGGMVPHGAFRQPKTPFNQGLDSNCNIGAPCRVNAAKFFFNLKKFFVGRKVNDFDVDDDVTSDLSKKRTVPSLLISESVDASSDDESYREQFRKKFNKMKKQAMINAELLLPPHMTFVAEVMFGIFGVLTQSIENCPGAMSYQQLCEVCLLMHEFYNCNGFTVFSCLLQEIASLGSQANQSFSVSNKISSSPLTSPIKSPTLSNSLFAKKPETCYYFLYVNLISAFEQLITIVQKSKVEYMHKVDCSRHHHKTCDLSKLVPIHHSLLGDGASQFLVSKCSTSSQSTPVSSVDKVCDQLKKTSLSAIK